jgi:hypothetical protein
MAMICERVLEYTSPDGIESELQVKIFLPKEDEREGGDWECSFSINGPAIDLQKTMYGADSVQALMHAIMGVDAHLKHIARTTKAKITWFGMENLGFSFPERPDR